MEHNNGRTLDSPIQHSPKLHTAFPDSASSNCAEGHHVFCHPCLVITKPLSLLLCTTNYSLLARSEKCGYTRVTSHVSVSSLNVKQLKTLNSILYDAISLSILPRCYKHLNRYTHLKTIHWFSHIITVGLMNTLIGLTEAICTVWAI